LRHQTAGQEPGRSELGSFLARFDKLFIEAASGTLEVVFHHSCSSSGKDRIDEIVCLPPKRGEKGLLRRN
jgi:hypothetical protein